MAGTLLWLRYNGTGALRWSHRWDCDLDAVHDRHAGPPPGRDGLGYGHVEPDAAEPHRYGSRELPPRRDRRAREDDPPVLRQQARQELADDLLRATDPRPAGLPHSGVGDVDGRRPDGWDRRAGIGLHAGAGR